MAKNKPPERPKHGVVPHTGEELSEVSEKRWLEAERRRECILPLLLDGRTRAVVEKRAEKYAYGVSSLYRWIAVFKDTKDVTRLIPAKPDGGEGELKVHKALRPFVRAAVEAYLTPAKLKIAKVTRDCQLACRLAVREIEERNAVRRRSKVKVKKEELEDVPEKNADGEYVHANTIRYQIGLIPKSIVDEAREGKKGKHKHTLNRGKFPQPESPLEMVQLDHTKMDVMIVDDVYRKSIGRCFITVALDIWSRAVTGYCPSLDPSGSLTTGICLSHSILSKKEWLEEHKIKAAWPVHGKPRTILLDNAKEFHSKGLIRACGKHGINIEYRPLGQPHYAGHIESFMKTLALELKSLPGATYSSVNERGEVKSEELAEFTFRDLEEWLALFICEYNNKMHSATHKRPVVKFLEGIDQLSEEFRLGALPEMDEQEAEELLVDFLPYNKCTVQKYGIKFYYHDYKSEEIESYVCQKDPKTGKSQEYTFRYDPRNMTAIWFYAPQERKYIKLETPSARFSLWEVKAAVKEAKQKGYKDKQLTQEVVDEMMLKRREIEARASFDTKSARRNTQKRKENEIGSTDYVKAEPGIPAALAFKPDPKKTYRPFPGLKVRFGT